MHVLKLKCSSYFVLIPKAVYDADLSAYFDSIPHDKLMKCLQMRITDRSVLKLIRMLLKAPVVEPKGKGGPKVSRRNTGTPQGGLCKALHNPPYAKKVLMQSIILKRWQNHKTPLIYFA